MGTVMILLILSLACSIQYMKCQITLPPMSNDMLDTDGNMDEFQSLDIASRMEGEIETRKEQVAKEDEDNDYRNEEVEDILDELEIENYESEDRKKELDQTEEKGVIKESKEPPKEEVVIDETYLKHCKYEGNTY